MGFFLIKVRGEFLLLCFGSPHTMIYEYSFMICSFGALLKVPETLQPSAYQRRNPPDVEAFHVGSLTHLKLILKVSGRLKRSLIAPRFFSEVVKFEFPSPRGSSLPAKT